MKMIMVKSVAFEAARGLMSRITDCHPYTSTDGLCDTSNFYMSIHKEATGYSVSCCKGGKIRRILKSRQDSSYLKKPANRAYRKGMFEKIH